MTLKKSKILLFCTCLLVFSCHGNELIINDLTLKAIPDNLAYNGNLIEAKKWTDKNGDNILIISRNGPYRTPDTTSTDNSFGNVELHAYQYLIINGSETLLWQTSEIIKDCDTDMWIEIFPNSTSITDLDKNGVTETTIVYRYSCKGGVDPSNMKVVLHEGKKLYCLQGLMYSDYEISKIDKTTFVFNLQNVTDEETKKFIKRHYAIPAGRYINDLDFKNAPLEFLALSRVKWIEYCDKDSVKQFYPADYQ